MRKPVGVLTTILALLLLLPGITQAVAPGHAEDLIKIHPKKYGIELTVGSGYSVMENVNNFIPDAGFINPLYMGSDEDDINISTQLGIGFSYRSKNDFGWTFGFNRLTAGIPAVLEQKFRRNAFFPESQGAESWAEQTVAGTEIYFTPSWYWDWNNKDVSFNIGPAIYRAKLDRSIAIVQSSGSGANPAGSFNDATGTSLGLLISAGLDIPMKESYFLTIKGGARLANVGKLTFDDNQDVEQTVWLNNSSNATLAVDFSGVFLSVGVRAYFQPSSDWRSPRQ